ncbi:uncharacterized protein LOC143209283 [Lasioglossum baleicum]|uniref:uncharacterized protein LOC143209283 n=1 Tax=Lasioglossum baleicum TaxID=434251 RepID=UPI003FCD7C68
MNLQYTYTKKRVQFGGQCSFSDNENVLVDIKPHAGYTNNYVQVDPATHGTQCGKTYSAHEVNTNTATFKDSSMCHTEGGWPKDLNVKDTEQVVRYKRKIEKDELYIHTMLQLLPPMEHCILQNNTCNIYEQYFSYMEPVSLTQRAYSRTVNVYRDVLPMKRQITHLSWSPDQGNYFAASYCNTDFGKRANDNPASYIWDVENPNTPCMTLKPFCPILTLEYNPKDCNILVSGLTTGQVACWDIRKGPEPVEISSIESSHRDVCNKVLWINSKTGTEFFSASKDGQIMWWDTRKLQKSTETLVIDLCKPEDQNVDNAIGISALQFEPSMGTRFMCGLENGVVISGNRKGKTPSEKIATRFKAQYGPVIGLERNPTFVKNFITIGDWTTRIWSEDCKESCITWTPGHRNFLMGGTWSVTRFSVFFLIKMDGTLDVWDLLFQQDSPILSIKVCDEVLTCIRPHEQGQLAAVANKNGTTFLLELSEALTTNQKNDKLLFTTLLDRETRREKVIEAKNRELRLKMKSLRNTNVEIDYSTGSTKTDEKFDSKHPIPDTNDAIIQICEQEYENAIEAETARQTEKDNEELNDNHLTNGKDNNVLYNIAIRKGILLLIIMNKAQAFHSNSETMELTFQNTLARRKTRRREDEASSYVISNNKSNSKNDNVDILSEDSVSTDKTIISRNTERPVKIFDPNQTYRFDNAGSTDLEELASKSMNVVVDVHREYKSEKSGEHPDRTKHSEKPEGSRMFSKTNTFRDRRNGRQKFRQVKSQSVEKVHDDIETVNTINTIEEFDGSSTVKEIERRERKSFRKNSDQFSSTEGRSRSKGKWGTLQHQIDHSKKPPRKRWSKDTSVIRLPEARGGSWAMSTETKLPLTRSLKDANQKSFSTYDNAAFVSDDEEILRIETDYNDRENMKIEMKGYTDENSDDREIPEAAAITIENLDESENSNFERFEAPRKSRLQNNDEMGDSDDIDHDRSDNSIVSQTLEDVTVRSNYQSPEETLMKHRRSTNKRNRGMNKKHSIDSQDYSSQALVSTTEDDDLEAGSRTSGNRRGSKSENAKRKMSKNVSSSSLTSPRPDVAKEDSKKKKGKKHGVKCISVMIHRADMLEIDYLTKHPMVKVHIVNAETGKYLKNGSSTFLQPIVTSKFDFKENRSIVPVWEEEIVFEHDFDSLLKTDNDQVVILFEIIDLLGFAEASFNYDKFGHEACWYKIAWAFLKPVGRNNVVHINRKVRLQLYKCRKTTRKIERFYTCEVYTWWKSSVREKYPSSLFVTIMSIDPPKLEPVLYQQLSLNELSLSDTRIEAQKVPSHTSSSMDLPKWSRLSAQSCKIPNEITFETEISENGCFFVAFSNNGKYLACCHSEEHNYSVIAYEIETKKIHVRFSGHKNFVYSLHWSENDNYLLSVSSDQTARIWDVQNQIMQHAEMMPHPSYVYCGKFDPESAAIVATGCYDRTVRIWMRDKRSKSRDLSQELEGHEGFINAMCFQQNSNLLSADSVGIIILWTAKKSRNKSTRKEWHISRKIKVKEINGVIINTILLHPLESRLLVHSRNSGLRMLDLATGVVLQKYNGISNRRIQSVACISPCGGLIFCGGEDSTLNVWNLETGSLLAKYSFDRNLRAVTCVDYHPYDHMLAFSTFGSPASVKILKFNREMNGEDVGLRLLEDSRTRTNVGEMSIRVLNTPATATERSRSSSRIQTPENVLKEKNSQSGKSGRFNTDESLDKNTKYTDAKLKLMRLNETEETMKSRSANRLYNIIEKIDRILLNTSRSSGDIECGKNVPFASKGEIFTIQNENVERRKTETEKKKSFAYLSGDDCSNSYFESSTTSSTKPTRKVVESKPIRKSRDWKDNRSQSAKTLKSNEMYEHEVLKTFSDSTANYQRNKARGTTKNMETSFTVPTEEKKMKPKEFLKASYFSNDSSNSSESVRTYVVEGGDVGGNNDEGSIKLIESEDLIENDTDNDVKDIRPGSDSSVMSNATFTIENEVPVPLPRRKKNLS